MIKADGFVKVRMLRCAASFVTATYRKYASFLKICAPCLRSFLLCRLISRLFTSLSMLIPAYLAQSYLLLLLCVIYLSAERAAMQPFAAETTTCLTSVQVMSPAANTPGIDVSIILLVMMHSSSLRSHCRRGNLLSAYCRGDTQKPLKVPVKFLFISRDHPYTLNNLIALYCCHRLSGEDFKVRFA